MLGQMGQLSVPLLQLFLNHRMRSLGPRPSEISGLQPITTAAIMLQIKHLSCLTNKSHLFLRQDAHVKEVKGNERQQVFSPHEIILTMKLLEKNNKNDAKDFSKCFFERICTQSKNTGSTPGFYTNLFFFLIFLKILLVLLNFKVFYNTGNILWL